MKNSEEKPRPPKPEEPAPRDDVVVSANRCPFCRDDVRGATTEGAASWVACAACLARHHEPCWGEGGGKCAACGHEGRLRPDAPTRPRVRFTPAVQFLAALLLSGLLLVALTVGVLGWRTYSMRRGQEESMRLYQEKAQREDALRREQHAQQFAAELGPQLAAAEARVGARKDTRAVRLEVARRQAEAALAKAKRGATPADAPRFEGALKALERLERPGQREYLMPPRRDHPDYAKFVDEMDSRKHDTAYGAHLLFLTDDARTALAEADRGLDLDAGDWLAWLARGESLLALGDHAGAALALTVSEAFATTDPTWVLLAQLDLAHVINDRATELAAAWVAVEVGTVPEEGGHRRALIERVLKLEQALGQQR